MKVPSRYLDGLQISEAVAVAGSTLPNTKAWIDKGYISQPEVVGKFRRFRSHEVIELILMHELNAIGIKPKVIGSWLGQISLGVVRYVDEYVREEDGRFVAREELHLRFWVGAEGFCVNVEVLDPGERVGALPQQSIVLRLASVLVSALNRARAIRERTR